MDLNSISVNKRAKKGLGQKPAIQIQINALNRHIKNVKSGHHFVNKGISYLLLTYQSQNR